MWRCHSSLCQLAAMSSRPWLFARVPVLMASSSTTIAFHFEDKGLTFRDNNHTIMGSALIVRPFTCYIPTTVHPTGK
ncbi:hypothetical protein F5Y18DRAFT_411356 [Xylariaceae sp. FL1019]|nr:hypothetical protein F5Y18DRAFT_411356 [Xylariaceae sp. FL1019]